MGKVDNYKDRLVKLLKTPGFYFCVGFMILNLFFTRQIMDANGLNHFLVVAIAEIIVESVSIFVIMWMRKRGLPLEKQFLFLALVLGTLFICILPPGQSPDEITHFRRAYGISRGIFVADQVVNDAGAIGSQIPKNTEILNRRPERGTYGLLKEEIFREDDELSNQPYTSAALYNFVCYIPQTLAALAGRVFNLSILATAYLMEVFNFVVWVLLVYFAIKILPKFKKIAVFVMLLPITLQEATSLSPDALTIGLSVFLVSYILYLAYGGVEKLSKKDYWFLAISALVIGFCKIVYLPLIFLMLVIPWTKFGTRKRKWVFLSCLIGLAIILNLVWLAISSRYLLEYRDGVDSKAQLIGIVSNPLRYLMVMFRTVNASGQGWLTNLLGTTLGSFSFYLPYAIFPLSYAVAIILFAQRDESVKLKKYDRTIFLSIFVVIMVGIFTSLYMQWTAVGAEVIDGIQGRYFLPILMLVPVIICRKKITKKYPSIISEWAILYYSLFINIVAYVTIFAQNV